MPRDIPAPVIQLQQPDDSAKSNGLSTHASAAVRCAVDWSVNGSADHLRSQPASSTESPMRLIGVGMCGLPCVRAMWVVGRVNFVWSALLLTRSRRASLCNYIGRHNNQLLLQPYSADSHVSVYVCARVYVEFSQHTLFSFRQRPVRSLTRTDIGVMFQPPCTQQ